MSLAGSESCLGLRQGRVRLCPQPHLLWWGVCWGQGEKRGMLSPESVVPPEIASFLVELEGPALLSMGLAV